MMNEKKLKGGEQIVKKYFTDNPRLIRDGGVVGDAIGSASAEVVRSVCQYALTRLHTRYKTDTDKPFVAHNLQEFYDTYKPVFKLGLTKEKIKEKFIWNAKNAEAILYHLDLKNLLKKVLKEKLHFFTHF